MATTKPLITSDPAVVVDALVDQGTVIVSATRSEMQHLVADDPIIVTGVGTLAAAMTVTDVIVRAQAAGKTIGRLVNIGTAGSLRDGIAGVYEITQVRKHDFTDDLLEAIDGTPALNDLLLETSGVLPGQPLATGDSFVADSEAKNRLAATAALVEMEGYAVAVAGYRYGIPVTLIKQVSDSADESAVGAWADAVPAAARKLNDAYAAFKASGFHSAVPVPAREELR